MTATCNNCQTVLADNARFCPQCGQGTKSYRQGFMPFLNESIHELLDIDGRLWLTISSLLTKPGQAAHDFALDKRARYTPPLRLYLAVSVIFFLVFPTFHSVFGGAEIFSSSVIELYSKAMFALFPMFAAYATAVYRGSFFISNLVFSLHIHTVAYVVLMFIGPLEALENRYSMIWLAQLPLIGYFVWYFFVAFKTMFGQSWPLTLVKAALVYIVYMATLGLVFDGILH